MHIIIRNAGDAPIYEQITEQIKAQIADGTLGAGDALPSMRVLAKELRVSVITTKRAYEELEREGFLHTVPGKGCYIAPQNLTLLREMGLRRVEEHLAAALTEARRGGIDRAEVQEILTALMEDEL